MLMQNTQGYKKNTFFPTIFQYNIRNKVYNKVVHWKYWLGHCASVLFENLVVLKLHLFVSILKPNNL